jgi:hypothetical protein
LTQRSNVFDREERSPLQRSPHVEAHAKSSVDRPRYAEATRQVETFRMRIANYVQKARSIRTSNIGDVVDETPSDSTLPEVRLDE